MSKTKKVLILIPVITCIVSAVASVLIYSNFSDPPYEKMIKAVVGKEDYKQTDSCEYSFERYYVYKDGSIIYSGGADGNYKFEKWD